MSFKREIAPDRRLVFADPFDANSLDPKTVLLLHGWGGNNTTKIIDSTGKAVTANGDAKIDTSQSVFGGSSLLLDGDSDYITVPDSTDWAFGSGDFTVDFWVRFNALPALNNQDCFVGQEVDATNRWRFDIANSADVYSLRFTQGSGVITSQIWSTPVVNTWYHIAFVRSGTTWYVFVDGVSLGSATATYTFSDLASPLYIGARNGTALFLDGWLDEFRVSKGVARWTTNFTKPTVAYGSPQSSWSIWNTGGGGAVDVIGESLRVPALSDVAGTLRYWGVKRLTFAGFPSSAQSVEVCGYLQLPQDGAANAREVDLFLSPTNPAAAPTGEVNYLRLRLLDNAGTYTRALLKRVSPAAEATVKTETLAWNLASYSPLVKIWLDATNLRVDLDGIQWQAKIAHDLTFANNQFYPILYHATSRTGVKTAQFDSFQIRYNDLPVS